MHFDLFTTLFQTNIQFKGVIQAGAHYGQEIGAYDQLGINKRILFEPSPHAFGVLSEGLKHRTDCAFYLVNHALGNENKDIEMFMETANRGESNSILTPALHLTQFPNIPFDEKGIVEMVRLDDWAEKMNIDISEYNLLVLDVQGYELEVLKGAEKTLENVNVVVTEILREELYEGCVMYHQLESFLNEKGFQMTHSNWVGGSYGDAMFVRQ